MNKRRTILTILSLVIVLTMIFGSAAAEDGKLFRRNVSKTPPLETAKAGLFMMDFYVPAQAATGELVSIENYVDLDGATVYDVRDYAKPLISVYIDGPSTHTYHEEDSTGFYVDGGIIFGAMDAFAGVSLDDGTTWKSTNISRTADLSSFTLRNGHEYPGHVHQYVHQVFGDNIIMAWVSKYCAEGTPLYSLDPESEYIADLETTYLKDAVYLYDLFGVAGSQGSVDYTLEGFPEVGEIPFSCVWTARGKLLAGDDPSTEAVETIHVMWTKPERLTSGKRDANLPAVDCAAAGCMLTWQEDPEGLRPGLGLGPGEGWSGAVANQQTDIWYSHISAADFDKVFSAEDVVDGGITMADYLLSGDTTMPKSYVPMAMPVRLTDNAMCKASGSDPYCYIDFDNLDSIDPTALPESPETGADFCAETVSWTNPGGTALNLCVTDDNRLMNGRVAATRVRLNFKPYTLADGTASAWIVMAAEESKALGTPEEDVDPVDIGKDVWYYSFDPFKTGTDEMMVLQGGMLNQPAQCNFDAGLDDPLCQGIDEGVFYPVQLDDRGYEFYLTEIARRFALTTNSVTAAVNSESGLSAMLIYKQGIINQGGPADIMLRRVLIDDTVFDPAVDNPYAYENMECAEWVYTDGSNPNYLQGLCLSPAINISSATITACDGGTDNNTCANTFPLNDDGSNNTSSFPKVYQWRQCQPGASSDICVDTNDDNDLDDQAWENPFDVAKGHRGFLDGDYVMMMYAWSPNWNSNAVGNDHYNLYVRRSFDGGLTWTTTPATLGGEGVDALEYYYVDSPGNTEAYLWNYGAGEPEQGRNVSLLRGNKITILDPRYSPTGGMKLFPTIKTTWLTDNGFSFEGLPYDDDLARDPSKFFMIYETGDNTTVATGEAIPLDLFYSRGSVYGDVWEWYDYANDPTDGDPEDGVVTWSVDIEPRWPWVENDAEILSGEAAMLVNPGGTFMYAVWNQWEEEAYVDEWGIEHEMMFNSDMPYRRFMYMVDDDTSESAPVAQILAAPVTALATDQLAFVGAGLDADDPDGENNIVSYEWFSNIDGSIGTGQILLKTGDQLSLGRHVITLVVTDDEGMTGSTTTILVIAGSAYHINIPFLGK